MRGWQGLKSWIVLVGLQVNDSNRAGNPILLLRSLGGGYDKLSAIYLDWTALGYLRMTIAIDTSQIAAMAAQMREAVTRVQAAMPRQVSGAAETDGHADFMKIFQAQLEQVSGLDQRAKDLGERFALGDDSVHLSDVMIAGQKAGIAMQATIQVRNKLVSAYHEIMNMQV